MTTIIVGIACFAAGGVVALMATGVNLKTAIAKELATLKADVEALKAKL